jgi:hypothetical protein
MKIYSIYDKVAQEFAPPDISKNHGVAVRKFRSFLQGIPENAKDDFTIYYLGEWEPSIGIVDVPSTPSEVTGFDATTGSFNDLTEVK